MNIMVHYSLFIKPLDELSAFPFENYLGWLKRLTRGKHNPVVQIVKRLKEWDSVERSSKDMNGIIDVKKNGSQLFHIEDFSSKDTSNIGDSWMLQLDQDDTIALQVQSGANGLHGCQTEDWINFTGQLLHAN